MACNERGDDMKLSKAQREAEKKCLPRMIWHSARVFLDPIKGWMKQQVQGTYIKARDGRIGS